MPQVLLDLRMASNRIICPFLQAGLVKAPAPELAAPPSLAERHADRMKKSGFIIPQEVRASVMPCMLL